jgi:hypothetical protein
MGEIWSSYTPHMSVTIANDASGWRRFAEGSVERAMVSAMGAHLGVELRPRLLSLTKNSRVEVEGIDQASQVVVQLAANQGAYKPAFRNKVMADMFKLIWLRSSVPTVQRAILVVTDVTVQALGGWVAVAAADLDIEVFVSNGSRVTAAAVDS